MNERMTIVIWQKPFSERGSLELLQEGYVCCPFAHSKENLHEIQSRIESRSFQSLKDYYQQKGYRYTTSVSQIQTYIDQFQQMKEGESIVIPHRSFDSKASSKRGYLCRIRRPSFFGHQCDVYGLFCPIEMIDSQYPLTKTYRKSMQFE